MSPEQTRLVWDWPLRLFHWSLAVAVVGAWLSGEYGGYDWQDAHSYFGFTALGLLIFRVVWGFAGPRHARFSALIPKFGALVSELRSLPGRGGREPVGHSSLASLAVVAMLLAVLVQAVSGLFMTDDVFFDGPWRMMVESDTAKIFEEAHHTASTIIAVLVGLHVFAIAYYRFRKGRRLVGPMIHGRKSAEVVSEDDAIAGSRSVVGLVVIAAAAALTWFLIFELPAMS